MSRIDFYHLQKQTLEEVLPKLLMKSCSSGKKVVVKIGTEERLEQMNSYLWTFQDESFLPHGSKKDGFAEQQPIWLTVQDDNPNAAEFLFLIDGAQTTPDKTTNYERIFNIFDGNAEDKARKLWKEYKTAGFDVFYWQQDDSGKWQQKV